VQNGEEVCDSCKQELGIVASEEDEDREVADWHKYIDDDDDDDDEEEGNDLADDIYSQDELEETSGIDEDFDFGGDLSKDIEEDEEDEEDDDFDFDIDDESFDDEDDEEDEEVDDEE